MRLPASVLGTLRVGLGATALMAGCDSPQARELEPALPTVPAPAEAEDTPLGLAAEVTALVERAAVEATPVAEEVFAAARPVARELEEELTAFVPFSEDPADAAPIRPRIRPRVRPLPRPRTEPGPAPQPTWSDGGCPACGRG